MANGTSRGIGGGDEQRRSSSPDEVSLDLASARHRPSHSLPLASSSSPSY
jgi:hypothetical protein